jgi:integrase
MPQGIETRTDSKGRKRYRGIVYSKVTGKRHGPWGSYAEAKSWRTRALGEIEAGTAASSEPTTLREEWEAFIAGARTGTVHDRYGRPYKPATLRGYERAWRRIDPELGAHRLAAIRRRDVLAFVDRLAAQGHKPATIRNTLDPLRTLYRRAIEREHVVINPTANVAVPRVENARERFATKEEAEALIGALPPDERALWATAMYGGLRSGELQALRWSDVDLDSALIRVRRSWDDQEGEAEPKTKGSKRNVPLVPRLLALLREHQRRNGRSGSDLVFGRSADAPFERSTVRRRARAAWEKHDPPLTPIGLHECRHTAASLMIAAGANAKALSVVMGHASIEITFNRYGKLMPGGEAEVGRLLAKHLDAKP